MRRWAVLRTGVGGLFKPLALRRGLGLCPKSSLGRRILGARVGGGHGEIPAASAGMTEKRGMAV